MTYLAIFRVALSVIDSNMIEPSSAVLCFHVVFVSDGFKLADCFEGQWERQERSCLPTDLRLK